MYFFLRKELIQQWKIMTSLVDYTTHGVLLTLPAGTTGARTIFTMFAACGFAPRDR